LLGSTSIEAYKTFLSELYHTDHGLVNTITVILSLNAPSEDMIKLLEQNNYIDKIIYLEGNPLYSHNLKRALVH